MTQPRMIRVKTKVRCEICDVEGVLTAIAEGADVAAERDFLLDAGGCVHAQARLDLESNRILRLIHEERR